MKCIIYLIFKKYLKKTYADNNINSSSIVWNTKSMDLLYLGVRYSCCCFCCCCLKKGCCSSCSVCVCEWVGLHSTRPGLLLAASLLSNHWVRLLLLLSSAGLSKALSCLLLKRRAGFLQHNSQQMVHEHLLLNIQQGLVVVVLHMYVQQRVGA